MMLSSQDFYPGRHGGWIEVISCVMYAGKSEGLVRRVRRALISRGWIQVFKSHLDDRHGGIQPGSSHDGNAVHAIPISTSREIAARVVPQVGGGGGG